MKRNRLGCLTGTGLIAALLTALLIAGFAYARGGSIYSPGPLSAQSGEMRGGVTSHAQTGGNCNACHTAPWEQATLADRCAACHTEIAAQMRNVASMHGTLAHNNPQLGCRDCHPEHRGADAKLTELHGADFPHEAVGFSLNGHPFTAAREPFTCQDCHGDDISKFDPVTCTGCHRQIDAAFMAAHALAYGTACLECHDGVDRFGKNFDHNRFPFRIEGKHAGVSCDQCHSSAHRLSDFSVTSQECDSCHKKDDPHDGRFGARCADCHNENGWRPAKFDHNLASFKLEGEHQEVPCDSCHINKVYKGTPTDCYSCHQQQDAHGGQYGRDCAICHDPSSWEHVNFDHNNTQFPLTGAHAGVECQRCHSSGQFTGLSTSCSSCHGDPAFHAGMFGLECASCHTTSNWSAVYKGPHPGIADEGGSGVNHGGGGCRSCHTQTLSTATCTQCHSGNPGGD
jgi:hypothetical protein